MSTSTVIPAALSQVPTSTAPIRIELVDAATPDPILREAAECILVALELGSPVWENMVPPPRAPLAVQIDRAAQQHRMALTAGKVYVRAVGTVDGGERTLGVAIWQRPGVRYRPAVVDSPEARAAFEGYDMVFRDAFFGGFQSHRDKLMGNRGYWYLSILVVSPHAQKLKIGSQLLDHGLQHIVDAAYPTLLEATPAGEKLYQSRGFVKEDEFTLCEQYPGMNTFKFPLYRRPASM